MTDQLKRRGGVRPGGGRPKSEPFLLPDLPATNDPLAFLMALVNESGANMRRRLNAAAACLLYVHGKVGETGKKAEKREAAEKAASGKFASEKPPVRLVP